MLGASKLTSLNKFKRTGPSSLIDKAKYQKLSLAQVNYSPSIHIIICSEDY